MAFIGTLKGFAEVIRLILGEKRIRNVWVPTSFPLGLALVEHLLHFGLHAEDHIAVGNDVRPVDHCAVAGDQLRVGSSQLHGDVERF